MDNNPFDQFDATASASPAQASGNPFDQFDATYAPAAPTQGTITATPGRDQLGQMYWQSIAQGDQATAKRAFDLLRSNGFTLPGPDEQGLDAIHAGYKPESIGAIPDFAVAATHHLASIPVGLAQLGTNLAAKAGDLMDGQPQQSMAGLISGQAPQRTGVAGVLDNAANAVNQYATDRENEYQNVVPTNIASTAGAAVGEVAPWLYGLGELRAAGMLPTATSLAGKIGLGTLEGGAMAAAHPVSNATDAGDYLGKEATQTGIGAVTGGAIPVAGKLMKSAISPLQNVAQHVINPQSVADANLARLFGNDPATLNRLDNPTLYYPGEQVSAAEAAPSPEAVAAQRLFRNNPVTGPQMVQQDVANNAQRLQQVQNVAGTAQDIADSRADRSAVVKPWIDANLSDSRPITRWTGAADPIDAALSKPMVRDQNFRALQEARKVVGNVIGGSIQEDDGIEALKELGDSVSQKYAPVFQQAMDAINHNMVNPSGVLRTLATIRNGPLGLATDNATGANIGSQLDQMSNAIRRSTNINGQIGTDMLDAVRQNASRMLGNAGSQGSVALGPARKSIVNAIDTVVPGYKQYLGDYAAMSQPLNTMDATSDLLDPNKVNSLNAAGQPNLTVSQINRVLRANEDATYPISPKAQQTLENLRDSLQRRSILDNKIAASGPGTAADVNAANFQTNGRLASAIFGRDLGRSGGWLGRGTGALVGGGLGTFVGGPVGGLIGAGVGGGITDALGAANRSILNRVAETSASSKATAAAIRRYQLNALGRAMLPQGNPVMNNLYLAGSRQAMIPATPQPSESSQR